MEAPSPIAVAFDRAIAISFLSGRLMTALTMTGHLSTALVALSEEEGGEDLAPEILVAFEHVKEIAEVLGRAHTFSTAKFDVEMRAVLLLDDPEGDAPNAES